MSDGSSWELDEAHADFAATCRAFVDKQVRPLVDDAESSGTFPAELWKQFGDAGILGLCTPDEFGGSEGDSLAVALLSEELARASGGIAISPLVSAYMAGTHLVRYGSDAQKQRWLAAIASGEAVAAIAVTEPGTGSDVAGITSRARTSDDGWVLDGRKMFITNAGLADVIVVGARTGEPGHRGITLFAVSADTPGLSFSTPLKKMGWHSSDTREVVLDGVEVSRDDVVGAEGRGFYQIMDGFELERIALAGMGIGHAAECLELSRRYVAEREAFGAPLSALQTIRHRTATMEIELEAARLVTYQAAVRLDTGHPEASRSVARAKYLSAVMANRVADDAVQLFGGAGFLDESAVARHYRDVRVLRIGGGTDEIQLEIMTKGMTP
ncbi:acyl-CoA dehydrogenase family protein [Pseudonocardia endophytica]|uniref:Acyl-CoA dehydrogenase/citronellyl-CoA dehydrogenase n=1 Tax=Pseudonocardia endophytica TaxID=401976 RepID=A0A4R1I099_PSEEN|nr:acyl-CoA dehydrogenase family protein [Pseudonocardia endophytica]TCK27273.1 acyl-CoA dehydrogenase/citronellyl-CoA dehydrogenase [Pseudonocardia endophytica]